MKRLGLIALVLLGFVAPAAAEISKDIDRPSQQEKLPRQSLERVSKDAPPSGKTIRIARTPTAVPKDK